MVKARARTLTDVAVVADTVVAAVEEKKGSDIVVIDLRNLGNSVTDMLVIASGGSDRQVLAIADEVQRQLREKHQERPFSTEGERLGEWVLLDYVNLVVHIFVPRVREFYRLEDLWGDAPQRHITPPPDARPPTGF